MVKNSIYDAAKEVEQVITDVPEDNYVNLKTEFVNEFTFKVSFDRTVSIRSIDNSEVNDYFSVYVFYKNKAQELKLSSITNYLSYYSI